MTHEEGRRNAAAFVKTFIISALAVLGITHFIARPVVVQGNSMYPTYHDGQHGITDLLSGRLRQIKRGDVIVVDEGKDRWIKRIIGLPGETLEARDGEVYVNGRKLEEPWLDAGYKSQHEPFTSDFGPVTLGDDEYFFMGDNRINSRDSRVVGAVSRDEIYGYGMHSLGF